MRNPFKSCAYRSASEQSEVIVAIGFCVEVALALAS